MVTESSIPGYVTVREAAAYLGRSHSQVCRYIRHQQLEGRRIGRELLIPAKALKRFSPPPRGNPNFLRPKLRA